MGLGWGWGGIDTERDLERDFCQKHSMEFWGVEGHDCLGLVCWEKVDIPQAENELLHMCLKRKQTGHQSNSLLTHVQFVR